MFSINNLVTYGYQGVCKITDITEKDFSDGKDVTYYVLKPVYDENSTVFVPVNNEALTSQMRRMLSADEIFEIIKAIPEEDVDWNADENKRKEKYRSIIAEGNRMELMKLVKTIYHNGKIRKESGKKMCQSDERIMKDAEKILYDEFAIVLNIKREQVLPFVMDQIQIEERRG